MQDSVMFELQVPLKFGKENQETDFVEIKCPDYASSGQRRYRRDLKSMLAAIIIEESKSQDLDDAQKDAAKEAMEDDELPFTPGQVLLTVSAALGDEFSKAIDKFCTHAQDFCLVGGEEPIKSGTLGRMDPDDVDMMFGTFVANFIMPSLLKNVNGNQ